MARHLAFTAVAASVAAAPAFAGSTEPAATEPVIAAPTPASVLSSPNWTGFYGGVQIGFGNLDTNIARSDNDVVGGIVGGYDHDFGQWVIGAGIDYDFADIDIGGGGASLDEIFRVKLRGGYKIGDGLLYATGGYANADTNTLGDDDGYFVGGGYEHRISNNFSVGGEVLYHEFDNFNSTTTDVEVTTVQVRGTFRF